MTEPAARLRDVGLRYGRTTALDGVTLDIPGGIMAGLIGLARQGFFKPGERVLFLHTGGLPSLHAYEGEVLGRTPVAD